MRKITLTVCLVLLAGLVVTPVPAVADEVPKDATWSQVFFPSEDGTMLHADVFLPKDRRVNDQHPVILSIGPYFGTNALNGSPGTESGPIMRFADMVLGGNIFERGYAYVQVDSRGYGGSEGCYDYGGEGEQMDAASAVEWAARQPWSNGRVGMWGKSYDAWTQVMALANRPSGLEAAVVQSDHDPVRRGCQGQRTDDHGGRVVDRRSRARYVRALSAGLGAPRRPSHRDPARVERFVVVQPVSDRSGGDDQRRQRRTPVPQVREGSNLEGKAAAAMKDVPELDVDKAQIKERSTKADFPPAMEPR